MEDNQQSLLNTPLHGVQLLDTANHLPNQAAPTNQATQLSNTVFSLPIDIQYANYQKPTLQPIWSLIDQGERYLSVIELYQTEQDYTLNIECEGTGSFSISQPVIKVNWQPQGTDFKHYLQSIGIATWLELNNIPCIHANAITYKGNAYLIIAPSRTGKSTLTTHLLKDGFKLMTDDMAAIYPLPNQEFMIYPSWPKVRLWPDSAENLAKYNKSTTDNLAPLQYKKVHQKFAKYEINLDDNINKLWDFTPTKLKAIYYLDRIDNEQQSCQIKPLPAGHSLMMLLQNSILANAYTSMNIEGQRLQTLAKMLTDIPVFNLQYTSGLNYLAEVNKQFKKHINTAL